MPRIKLRSSVKSTAHWAVGKMLVRSEELIKTSSFGNDTKLIVDWTAFFGTQLSQLWAVRLRIASLGMNLAKYTVEQMELS